MHLAHWVGPKVLLECVTSTPSPPAPCHPNSRLTGLPEITLPPLYPNPFFSKHKYGHINYYHCTLLKIPKMASHCSKFLMWTIKPCMVTINTLLHHSIPCGFSTPIRLAFIQSLYSLYSVSLQGLCLSGTYSL